MPTLRPGDIVVLDNLGSHRSRAIRSAIRDAGAKLAFLPPYSPDLNPIEQVFAKVKHWMRMAQARSIDAIHDRIAKLVAGIAQAECASYLTKRRICFHLNLKDSSEADEWVAARAALRSFGKCCSCCNTTDSGVAA